MAKTFREISMSVFRWALSHWRGILRWVLFILITLAIGWAFSELLWLDYKYGWTEFGTHANPAVDPTRVKDLWGKSVWDWLDLLIVPVVLAVGGLLFTWTEREAKEATEKRRAEAERNLTTERARESALQGYLDKMTSLLIENKLRDSEPNAEVRDIARARTLTVLRMLDADRRGLLLRFLHEAALIGCKPQVDLGEANLHGANLRGANLRLADLGLADLTEADLREARLIRTNLTEANLTNANLDGANLRGGKLIKTDLNFADLNEANLTGAT